MNDGHSMVGSMQCPVCEPIAAKAIVACVRGGVYAVCATHSLFYRTHCAADCSSCTRRARAMSFAWRCLQLARSRVGLASCPRMPLTGKRPRAMAFLMPSSQRMSCSLASMRCVVVMSVMIVDVDLADSS